MMTAVWQIAPYLGAYEHEHMSGLTTTKAIAIGVWVSFWYFVHWCTPFVGRRLYSKQRYESMKYECDARVVALVHALMASSGGIIATYVTYSHWTSPELRMFGSHPVTSVPMTISLAYFLWDVLFSLRNPALFGLEFVVHAIMALVIFSTPHSNKLMVLFNDVTLAFYFVTFRLLYGPYKAYYATVDVYHFYSIGALSPVHLAQSLATVIAVLLLCVLNFYWFATLILPGILQVFCGSGRPPQMKKNE